MDNILREVSTQFNAEFQGVEKGSGFYLIKSDPDFTKGLLEILLRDSRFWCDHLVSLSGVHRMGESELIRVHYHLVSIPTGLQVHVFTEQTVETPNEMVDFESVVSLWKSAEWHERETGELYGIRFLGHPDQRNLLLPTNWEGFPLRKNYVEQDRFHGIKVKY